jgi:hypothetical protein
VTDRALERLVETLPDKPEECDDERELPDDDEPDDTLSALELRAMMPTLELKLDVSGKCQDCETVWGRRC